MEHDQSLDFLAAMPCALKLPLFPLAQLVNRFHPTHEVAQRDTEWGILQLWTLALVLVGGRMEESREPNAVSLSVIRG
jgi:hypothetical protein